MLKVYIAGKVTGLPFHEVTMKFGEAQVKLQQAGFEVVNPLQVVSNWYDQVPDRPYRLLQTPWQQCMRLCIAELVQCDAAVFLPCWTHSRGALVEMNVCIGIELPYYYGLSAETLKMLQQKHAAKRAQTLFN